jgi:hypothetical protein
MKIKRLLIFLRTAATLAVAAAVGSLIGVSTTFAQDGDDPGQSEASMIRRGFEVAPVLLNMVGKNPALVGLGSYLVNVVDHCNTCHSAGPATQWAPGHNPFFGQDAAVNPATYMGGGRVFPPLVPTNPSATPTIISRNLTPDKTGLPEGGRTFEEFAFIIRTGTDLDRLHPNCVDPTQGPNTTCFSQTLPFDGNLLQVMPWPDLRHITEHQLRAIYEYLKAIPCVPGPADPTSPLHNDCGP